MSLKFEAGMHVRYGGNGICLIDRIEDVPSPDFQPPRRCYILKPLRNNGMVVSVPVDSEVLCAKLKPLLSREEIDRMLSETAQQEPMEWQPDRKLRGSEFRRILSAGDADQLLRLIRCVLHQRSLLAQNGKHLSAMDENFRKDAERMLDDEFAFSLGITPIEAGKYICRMLDVPPRDVPQQ